MKFLVLAGTHIEEGVTYTKNQVIETEHDLLSCFTANRFQRIAGDEPVRTPIELPQKKAKANPVPEPTPEPVKEEEVKPVYEVEPDKARGWYNVINMTTKKPVNDSRMRRTQADTLKDSLND